MSSISAAPQFQSQRVDQFDLSPFQRTYRPKSSSVLNRISGFVSDSFNPVYSYFVSEAPPVKIGGFDPKVKRKQCEVIAFGDIHGELRGLFENLLNADLIDEHSNWKGESKVLVQLGDVIDRGYYSEAVWHFLAKLQGQAEESSGEVIRLIGNHELMVLEGIYGYAAQVILDPEAFGQQMKQDILDKKVQLAYTDGKRLFLHAGLRTEVRNLLVKEIMSEKKCEAQEVYVEDIVNYLNHLLVEALSKDDFSHPIFYVGHSRGGEHSIGGVLWEDLSELANSKQALDIPQVVGHNPPRYTFEPPIRITDSQRLIEVDAGLNPVYGGNQAYVVFEKFDIRVRVKDQKEGWVEQVAHDVFKNSL